MEEKRDRFMKYIRTEDGHIFDLSIFAPKIIKNPSESKDLTIYLNTYGYGKIVNQADTIEELCDEFVVINKESKNHSLIEIEKDGNRYTTDKITHWIETLEKKLKRFEIYGAIWTDKGLTYVAKMNDKGELELL